MQIKFSIFKSFLAIGCLAAGCAKDQRRTWQAAPPGQNPIPSENALPGDPDWQAGATGVGHAVELYLDRVSAHAGDPVQVKASVDAPHAAAWALYRLGWYGGAGARKIISGAGISLVQQPLCPIDPARGEVRCSWATTLSFAIPANAVSGLYLVKITRDDGTAATAPLVIEDDRPAALLFQSSVTTAQAYNPWGGESLYEDESRTVNGAMATAVSFDRPYAYDGGSGEVLRWEALFARFLERNGYDVSYTTNLDVARAGQSTLAGRGAFLSVGHDEYWPPQERDAADAARDAGMPLLFFGADAAYWKVRLEDPGSDGNARTIVCYKQHPESDPQQGPARTGRFRDAPENRPENALVGVMYQSWVLVAHGWTVADASHFLYRGTGLAQGDTIPQLVGYEYDNELRAQPPGALSTAAHSVVVDAEGMPGSFDSTSYRAPSGALVFGAGTIYWSTGLDGPLRDPRVERMTANVLHEALGLPVPAALPPLQPSQPTQTPAPVASLVAQGFAAPSHVALLPGGALAVSDPRANQIFRVEPSPSNAVSVLAGDGSPDGSPAFDGVPGAVARFFGPTALVADAQGNLYVADTHNSAIRRIANDAQHTVTTWAGLMQSAGAVDGTGGAARLNKPMGLCLDAARGRLLVADSVNQQVRAIDLVSAQVTTLAGSGAGGFLDGPAAVARFDFPTAVAVAADGRIFVVSSGDSTLKVIGTDPARTVTTLVAGGAGYLDGPGTDAKILAQSGLAWDEAAGALYLSDPGNGRIRLVRPGTDASSTTVSTFAGTGRGDSGDTSLGLPLGLALGSGLLYVVDASTGSVRSLGR